MADTSQIADWFSRLQIKLLRRRRTVLAAVLAVLVLAAAVLGLAGEFSGDAAEFFSAGSEVGNAFAVMRESGLANRMAVEITFRTPAEAAAELENAARLLLSVPGVKTADYGFANAGMEMFGGELDLLYPYSFEPEVLLSADPGAAAKSALKLLMTPGIPTSQIAGDPANFRGRLLSRLAGFRDISGLKLAGDAPLLVGADGRRGVILVGTEVSASDGAAAGKLLEAVSKILDSAGVRFRILAAHRHTVENQRTISRDVAVVGAISAAVLVALFFVCYRGRVESMLILLAPLAGSLAAAAVLALVCKRVLLFVLGMGGGILGLAVDYGIHVYAARCGGGSVRRLGRLALPLISACATTAGVFVLLVFSGVNAYWQLGIFAGVALAASLAAAWCVLPALIPETTAAAAKSENSGMSLRARSAIIALSLIFCAGAVWLLPRTEFNLGVSELDGAEKETFAAEKEFDSYWRSAPAPAMLAVVAPDAEAVLEKLELLSRKLVENGVDETEFFSPAQLCSSEARRGETLEKWRAAVASGEVEARRKAFAVAAAENHLPENFYDAFFERVSSEAADGCNVVRPLPELVKTMFYEDGKVTASAIFLRDESALIAAARRAAADMEGCAVISEGSFKQMLADDVGGRVRLLLPAATILVALTAWCFLRNPVHTFLALLPPAFSAVGVAMVFAVLKTGINLSACMAMLLLFGLAVDFGIFGVFAASSDGGGGVRKAMRLSFFTTAAGVGTLLFSRHPAMFYTGLTLFTGVVCAFLTGYFLIPALLTGRMKGKAAAILVLAALVGVGGGCAGGLSPMELTAAQSMYDVYYNSRPTGRFRLTGTIVAGNCFFDFAGVFAAVADPAERALDVTLLTPTGGKVLSVEGRDGEMTAFEASPLVDRPDAPSAALAAFEAFNTVTFFPPPPFDGSGAVWRKCGNYIELRDCDHGVSIGFSGGVAVRASGGGWWNSWQLEIGEAAENAFPGEFVLKKRFYDVIVKVDKVTFDE